MTRSASERRLAGAMGAHESWARTVDRTARTAPARAASPADVEWHVARLDPELFADADDEQRRAAGESARSAYFKRLAFASAQARARRR